MKSPITTHILDTARGRPARDVAVVLDRYRGDLPETIGEGRTNEDGRVTDLMPAGSLEPGRYRISFDTGGYYARTNERTFYPKVSIDFTVEDATEHYHVPLLLNPFGFSTYRGS